MLEVILYPVQGRSVGEGPFNREVDICEWTFEKKNTKMNVTTASSPPGDSKQHQTIL